MTLARLLFALPFALHLAACGNVSGGGASTSGSSGSRGSLASRSSSSSVAVVGCPGSILDAGGCTGYASCVTSSVTGSCKSSYDACYASGGPCASYLACTASCNCADGACVSACSGSMSAMCSSCLQTASSCSENACSAQIAQCLVGINDAATHTCADLAKCCGSLPASEQSVCAATVAFGNDAACSTLFAASACP